MTTKTVEKVTHSVTPKGLPLYIKWTEGRELLRNSRTKAGKEGWEPATTLGTRVVIDTSCGEHAVYVYINEKRYYPADYFCDDKSEALEMAKTLREFNSFGVKAKPKAKAKTKTSPKGKKKTATKAKSSPKGKKATTSVKPRVKVSSPKGKGNHWSNKATSKRSKKAKSSPKEKSGDELMDMLEAGIAAYAAKQPVARRARHQDRQPSLKGMSFTISADNKLEITN